MELSAGKWGNSIAVRLPRNLAQKLGVEEGGALLAEETAVGIVLKAKKPTYSLEELLQGMTEDQGHEESVWGAPRGNEVW